MQHPTPPTTETLTTAQQAAQIRRQLKARLGATARQISVRSSVYSGGSSINVTVKDPAISLSAVKEIAEQYRSVRRCQATGEILSGGNTYVFVDYDTAVFRGIREQIQCRLPTDGGVAEIAGFTVNQDPRSGAWLAGCPGHQGIIAHFPESLAQQLAIEILDLGLLPMLQRECAAPTEDPQCWIVSEEFLGRAA